MKDFNNEIPKYKKKKNKTVKRVKKLSDKYLN